MNSRHAEPVSFLRAQRLPLPAFQKSGGGSDVMTTYYATLFRPGALWNPEKPAREQPYWADHARFMDHLFEAGAVVLGGPFADRTGSLVIVKAGDAAQVLELFRGDPWTEHDVLVVGDVKEWVIFLDAREPR